jgi:hypothetical protein
MMKSPTINTVKKIVKDSGATSGILILFHEPTTKYAAASYGIDREQCQITVKTLDVIIQKLESGEIEVW